MSICVNNNDNFDLTNELINAQGCESFSGPLTGVSVDALLGVEYEGPLRKYAAKENRKFGVADPDHLNDVYDDEDPSKTELRRSLREVTKKLCGEWKNQFLETFHGVDLNANLLTASNVTKDIQHCVLPKHINSFPMLLFDVNDGAISAEDACECMPDDLKVGFSIGANRYVTGSPYKSGYLEEQVVWKYGYNVVAALGWTLGPRDVYVVKSHRIFNTKGFGNDFRIVDLCSLGRETLIVGTDSTDNNLSHWYETNGFNGNPPSPFHVDSMLRDFEKDFLIAQQLFTNGVYGVDTMTGTGAFDNPKFLRVASKVLSHAAISEKKSPYRLTPFCSREDAAWIPWFVKQLQGYSWKNLCVEGKLFELLKEETDGDPISILPNGIALYRIRTSSPFASHDDGIKFYKAPMELASSSWDERTVSDALNYGAYFMDNKKTLVVPDCFFKASKQKADRNIWGKKFGHGKGYVALPYTYRID